jgi:hypothetical protein
MSHSECVAEVCTAHIFLLNEGADEEIGDAGGLDTSSIKEPGMEKIFWQILS